MSAVQSFFADGGSNYKSIPRRWCNVAHFFVNHNKYFVDKKKRAILVPVSYPAGEEEKKQSMTIHSNTIEGHWGWFKTKLWTRRGVSDYA